MSLPKILIIDDELSTNLDQRGSFCFKCHILDEEAPPPDPTLACPIEDMLGEAVFCSGQKDGRNSYEVIQESVHMGIGHDGSFLWALVLLDVKFEDKDSTDNNFGLEVKDRLLASFPNLPIVMLTSKPEREISKSDDPYLSKTDVNAHRLKMKLLKHGALSSTQIEDMLQLKQNNIVVKSPALLEVFKKAFIFAEVDVSILILGETGTGKEVLAKYIHKLSPRRLEPFIARNIAEIHKDMLSSELFGIEKKTATEVAEREGLFAHADKGTLFLDEIGDMPLETQQTVLRVLEEREFVRVGGRKGTPVDIRLLSATSKDIGRLKKEKLFREDLYFRIATMVIKIPPLRKRREDIPGLAKLFLESFKEITGKKGISFSEDAIERLKEQDFLGNVRQLKNLVERIAVQKGNDEIIRVQDVLREIEDDEPEEVEAPQSADFANLESLLQNLKIPSSRADLEGKIPSLQKACGQLVRRMLETALEQTRDSRGNTNFLYAINLLLGEEKVKGTADAYAVFLRWLKAFPPDRPLDGDLEIAWHKAIKSRQQTKSATD